MSHTNIAILGSCVTRDAFVLPRGQKYRLPTYVARTSFISITAPPISIADGTINGPHQFDVQCLEHDFRKTAIETMLSRGLDYVILDFVDERFDLMRIAGSLVTDSRYARDYGVIDNNQLVVEGTIPRVDPATTDMWKRSCVEVAQQLLARLRPEQIILHSCKLASEYISGGERKTFVGYYADLTSSFNPIFAEYEAFFLSQVPGCRMIRLADDLVLGDEDHRWKLQPFHYVPGYYEAFLDQLAEITGSEGASAASA